MEFPKYIMQRESNGYPNALTLIGSKDNEAIYWRHAGCYMAEAQYKDGKLMVYIYSSKPYEYIGCSEDEWLKDNAGYTSDEYHWRWFNKGKHPRF